MWKISIQDKISTSNQNIFLLSWIVTCTGKQITKEIEINLLHRNYNILFSSITHKFCNTSFIPNYIIHTTENWKCFTTSINYSNPHYTQNYKYFNTSDELLFLDYTQNEHHALRSNRTNSNSKHMAAERSTLNNRDRTDTTTNNTIPHGRNNK